MHRESFTKGVMIFFFPSEIKRYVNRNIQKRSLILHSVDDEISTTCYKKRKCSYQSEDSGYRPKEYSKTVSTSDGIYVPSRESARLSSKYEAVTVNGT
jgi:hypothetical protein